MMELQWLKVATVVELPEGARKVVYYDREPVILVCIDGQVYAVGDICTHDGGELSDGCIEGCTIVCSRHGARFSLATGEVLAAPAYEPLPTYQVRMQDGNIEIMPS